MKKYYFLIIAALIFGLVLTGCSLLSNIGQAPATDQSGITYLTKGLPSGLVGWWRFNGDATDSSGNGNNGTVYGTEDYVGSPMGQALTFDGVNNYVDCGNVASLRPTSALTVEAWVNYASFFSDSAGHAIVSEAQYTSNGFMLYQACGAPYNSVRYFVRTDTGLFIGQSGTQLSANTWYHLAMTYDGSDLTLYIGGEYDSSISATGAVKWSGTTPNLYIGSTYTAGGAKFKGLIDDVRIWNVALSEGQLGKIYEFTGFFSPVENPPMWNVVKAGRAIPVKFSLDGDQGLKIFEVDYPKSTPIACPTCEPVTIDEIITVTAGGSSLSYDATNGQYTYVWKTEKDWTDCRQLIVKLIDGTYHIANFTFK